MALPESSRSEKPVYLKGDPRQSYRPCKAFEVTFIKKGKV